MVLPGRIELTTSPLPRECSTTELRQRWAASEDVALWVPQAPSSLPQGGKACKRCRLYGSRARALLAVPTVLFCANEPSSKGSQPAPEAPVRGAARKSQAPQGADQRPRHRETCEGHRHASRFCRND